MSGWLGLLLVLAILAGISLIRCGVHIRYEQEKLSADAKVLFVRIPLSGDEKKPSSKGKKKENPAEEAAKPAQKKAGVPQAVKSFLPYWQEILSFCGRVLTSPTIDCLRVDAEVGGKDACACALLYGRVCAAVNAVLPVVENTFTVRERHISVECCFEKKSLEIRAEAVLSLRIYEIIVLAAAALKLLLRIRRENKNTEKAVQTL